MRVGYKLLPTSLAALMLALTAHAQTENFTYDDLGRLVIVDHGDGKATTYTLDPAGNRKTTNTSDGTPPTAPTNLDAVAVSTSQINLTWTAATDNVAVTGYRVERCEGPGCSNFAQIATPATTSHSDTTLTEITSYTYRVRAGDAGGNLGPFSNSDTAVTLDGTAPTVPGNLAATPVSGTQINLSWNASSDNLAVTGYSLERCTGVSCSNFAEVATPPPGTSFSNTSLTDYTTYRYRLRARDAVPNWSGYSSIVNASTPDVTAPSTPTGLVATPASPTSITLSWNASSDNASVSGYRLERCQGSGCSNFTEYSQPPTNSYNFPAGPSTTYNFRVRAADAATNLSGYSSTATATTPAGVPPSPVVSPASPPTLFRDPDESYSVNWGSVAGATTYQLFENGNIVWSGTATSQSFTAVIGTWTYTVKACNASGCSNASSTYRYVVVEDTG